MKIVSDKIADFLEEKGIDTVFGIIGSANSYLFESISNKGYTKIVYVHHEQAAVMAAGAYYRTSGKMSAAIVTAGPGAANAVTGVVSNWADSIPTLILSGQESTKYLDEHRHLRMLGTQGFDAVTMLKDVTKYANVLRSSESVMYEMEKSYYTCLEGRPGPVWLEIPFDIQSSAVNEEELAIFREPLEAKPDLKIEEIVDLINASKRPVILGGHGIRLSGSKREFQKMVKQLKIPTLLTWSGIDLLPESEEYYFGKSGIYGQRCANFVVQNCDLLIVLGSRLALPQTGYDINNYAPCAKIVMVNNDEGELHKHERYDLKINANVRDVILGLLEHSVDKKEKWHSQCLEYQRNFPIVENHHVSTDEYVNSYEFLNNLSDKLDDNHVIVVGMGTAMASGHQAFKTKKDQIMFTSNGLGEMGWGLPSLVGASFASEDRKLLCLMSDGSMMMNLQELQTIIAYDINVKIVVFNNDGYLFIKHTQKMLFNGNFVGVNKDTGIVLPEYKKIASAFGFEYFSSREDDVEDFLSSDGASIYEVFMHPEQPLKPKVVGIKTPDGILAPPIEEMSPLLEICDIEENMLIGVNEKSYKIRSLT